MDTQVPGFSKPDEAYPGMVEFSISISESATCVGIKDEKLGPFLWFSNSTIKAFLQRICLMFTNKLLGNFRLYSRLG